MDNSVPSSSAKKGSGGKVLSMIIVFALIVLVVVLDMRRRDAEKKLMELTMQVGGSGNEAQNQEVAKQVIDKVRKLYVIPAGIEPTVATIVDVNQLRTRNAFYNKAKNGDHLIVTNDRAILYDPIADKIIDVVPVQIQAPAADQAAASSDGAAMSAPAAMEAGQ